MNKQKTKKTNKLKQAQQKLEKINLSQAEQCSGGAKPSSDNDETRLR